MVSTNTAIPAQDHKTAEIKEDLQRYSEELYQMMQGENELNKASRIRYSVEELEDIPMAAKEALNDSHRNNWTPYITDMVDQVSRGLRGKSPEELLMEAKRLAKGNPAVYLAGGVVMGVGLAFIASHLLNDE